MKQYLVKRKKELGITILVTIISAAINVYAGYSLTFLLSDETLGDLNTLIQQGIIVSLLFGVAILSSYLKVRVVAKTIATLNTDVRSRISVNITKMNFDEYNQKETGNYVSWYTNDVEKLKDAGFSPFFDLFENAFGGAFALIAITLLNKYLAAISIILFAFLFVFPKVFERMISREAENLSKHQEKFTEALKDIIMGVNTLRIMNLNQLFLDKIRFASKKIEAHKCKYIYLVFGVRSLNGIVNAISQIILVVVTVFLVTLNVVSIGAVISIANLSGVFFSSILSFINGIVNIKSSKMIFNKFNPKHEPDVEKRSLDCSIEVIDCKNISFKYGDRAIFEDVNLKLEKGRKYVVVGESGAGKSTLSKIIIGLIDRYEGDIFYNGINRKEISDVSIFDKISYIDQDVYLLAGTIKDNICMGQEYTQQELQDVLNKCRLTPFLANKEMGLSTIIEEGGKGLSGGEKQRIALARMLIRNPEILLIDEGFSAIDKQNSKEILMSLMNDSQLTVFMITHHLDSDIKILVDNVYTVGENKVYSEVG
jgi:ABC-type bacteriocin/lantibiotic exporter with double-glycine peptidase domain